MDGVKWQILLKKTDIRQITMSRNVKYYFYLLLVFLRLVVFIIAVCAGLCGLLGGGQVYRVLKHFLISTATSDKDDALRYANSNREILIGVCRICILPRCAFEEIINSGKTYFFFLAVELAAFLSKFSV